MTHQIRRGDFPATEEGHREYNRAWYQANKESVKARAKQTYNINKEFIKNRRKVYMANYYENSRGMFIAKAKARKNHINLKATPKWLSSIHWSMINQFYTDARKKTNETGILHVVDHIWPLNGEFSCGLNVPWNLQVITQAENDAKGNKEPEQWL